LYRFIRCFLTPFCFHSQDHQSCVAHVIFQAQSLHTELIKLGVPEEEAIKQLEALQKQLEANSKGSPVKESPNKESTACRGALPSLKEEENGKAEIDQMRQELKVVQRKIIAGEDSEENEKLAAELERQLDDKTAKTKQQKRSKGGGVSRRGSKTLPSPSKIAASNGTKDDAISALDGLVSG